MQLVASRRFGTLSPLRYPGGKAALAGLFTDVIERLGLHSATYVEPYAGGAGAGIALLRNDIIDRLVINDLDPAVHAFWWSVLNQNAQFVRLVQDAELTVTEWRRQREVYRACEQADPLALGFAFFFLNRTNRSGVLRGGVIGGLSQEGAYKIDARFNRETLTRRIEALGRLSDRITVTNLDGRVVVLNHADDPNTLMYIDPPYVRAGSQLYLNSFEPRDHNALAQVIKSVETANWLLTYDASPFIERLYAGAFMHRYSLNYSARHPGRADELLIASQDVARALQVSTLMRDAVPTDA